MLLPILALLVIIIYQDYKFRAVWWWVFPVLSGAFVLDNYLIENNINFTSLGVNILFVVTILLVLTLFLSLKNRRFVLITNNYLGLGDILFFLVLSIAMSPLNFTLFFVGSLLFTILLVLVKPNLASRIPLAGIQASLFAIIYSLGSFFSIGVNNDYWILNQLF